MIIIIVQHRVLTLMKTVFTVQISLEDNYAQVVQRSKQQIFLFAIMIQ